MAKSVPSRKDIPEKDKWDLSTLYRTDGEWEAALSSIPGLAAAVVAFKGRLGESSEVFLSSLRAFEALCRVAETVSTYASLLYAADEGDAAAQDKDGRATIAVSAAFSEVSFYEPELLSLPDEKIIAWKSLPEFADYRVFIEKTLHAKPHTLGEREERVLALQAEAAQTAHNAFSLLPNVDISFGMVPVGGEERPLTQSSWQLFMENPDRSVRKAAYERFYGAFESHANTLAALYAGSVSQDVFIARARGYGSSLQSRLYGDKVPESVYRNLIGTVRANLPVLHRFYALRKRVLGLSELRHYDVYVPLAGSVWTRTSYEEAVEICRAALAPLGAEYTDTLCAGLLGGWVDRYENKGKRGGAFSSGAYTGHPYILLNYKDDAIRDVFTMAHEGGHSMHSWYSRRNNPFMQHSYTIFEAEVASTFNEELLFRHLLANAADDGMRRHLLSMRAGDIVATLHRQTMFAEFELLCHESVERGSPLSAQNIRSIYRGLLEQYFGADMVFERNSDLEGLRIPHFYGAFYVYKYATGISAALALAQRVCGGGKAELDDYFAFLASGGSRYPIESLKAAGVDMSSPAPVQSALDSFASLVDELERIL